jgi:sulfite exporter TauE/SafE
MVGALFQALQIMNGPAQPWSYNSGRIVGGMFVGAAIGAITAVIRNTLLAGK